VKNTRAQSPVFPRVNVVMEVVDIVGSYCLDPGHIIVARHAAHQFAFRRLHVSPAQPARLHGRARMRMRIQLRYPNAQPGLVGDGMLFWCDRRGGRAVVMRFRWSAGIDFEVCGWDADAFH
jgi:hypothetical protein